MIIEIRRMRFDDIEIVYRLEQCIFKNAWSFNSFIAEVNNQRISYPCVMIEDFKIVGYAVVWHYSGEVHIGNFAIDPEKRKQGFGKRLLQHILHKFEDYEAAFLEVRRSNIAAINLYRKFDFREFYIRPAYYSDGEDAIVMIKNLQKNEG